MGCIIGRMMLCDRCGKTHFCPRTGQGSMDGALWETYEPWPNGWHWLDFSRCVCPECAVELRRKKKDGDL